MNHETTFPLTDLNRVRRVPSRGIYDRDAVYEVIDAAWLAHLAFDGEQAFPITIPMVHARLDDQLIFHGAQSSRLMKRLAGGAAVAVSFAIVDGLVLAKSLMHHSMNYRSAVVFGHGERVDDTRERERAFQALTDRVMPGRWNDARQPNENELKATMVVRIKMESGSAKIRSGGPVEEKEDEQLEYWSGVVPIQSKMLSPETDSLSADIPIPTYVTEAIDSQQSR